MQAAEETGGTVFHRNLNICILHRNCGSSCCHITLTIWNIASAGPSYARSCYSRSIGVQSNVSHGSEVRVSQYRVMSAQVIVIDVAA